MGLKRRVQLFLIAALLALANVLVTTPVFAANETISAGTTATTELKTATPITGITINGADNSTVPVKLLVTNGTLSMTTTTGLTFTNASGGVLSNPQSGSTLYFSGSRSDVNTALSTLRYLRNTTGTDTLEISLVNPGEVFFSGNGHLYEYVSSTLAWDGAKTAAEGRTKYGATGYLTTITSQEENDFVAARLVSAGWMGASDAAVETNWRWVTGPENGTTFCIGNTTCVPQSGRYTNWNNAEPNDSGGNEDCGQFLAGGTGKWNDLPCSGTTLPGYVVEYGATGDMPSVAAANIAITTSDTTAPTTPGTPSASSPTVDTTPAVSWTAATDSGVGLKNPAYTLEWSTGATFTVVSGSTTTNSTSVSTSALADGIWYFRVKATDSSNNVATSAISSAVVVDTTAPTTPGTPSVGAGYTNDITPTWSWDASTDSGVGLDNPAYYVQWSTDPTLSGLNGQSNAVSNSYTIPDYLPMTDGTWYFRVSSADTLNNTSALSAIGSVIVDTVAPVVSDVTTTSGGAANQQGISWSTHENASSIVSYGPTTNLGTTTTEIDVGTRVQSHSVVLTNLISCSIYHFKVTSTDAAGNTTTSGDQSFITNGCAGSADVLADAVASATTASGGSVSLDTIAVTIPSGYANDDADFQIKQINRESALLAVGNPVNMLLAGGKVYDVKALTDANTSITSFSKPLSIALQYTAEDIAGLAESSLAIYRWDPGTGWAKLDNCTVDTVARSVTCTTTHFSTFALYGTAKVPALAVATNGNTYRQAHTGTGYEVTSNTIATDDVTMGTDSQTNSNDSQSQDKQQTTPEEVTKNSNMVWWWLCGIGIVLFLWVLIARRRRDKDEHDTTHRLKNK